MMKATPAFMVQGPETNSTIVCQNQEHPFNRLRNVEEKRAAWAPRTRGH
jgi:hypothetical protein